MPRLDMIGLVTRDLPAALAFYRRLGVEVPAAEPDAPHVEAALPGGMRIAWDREDVIRSMDAGWRRPEGGARVALAFLCDSPGEVDGLYAEMAAHGHGHLAPFDAPWGQRYAVLHDPDGNAVDLFAPLAT